MWVPKTEEEIKNVVLSRQLEETSTFDAKQKLSSIPEEIAKDIAAMTVDGGVIIYGIGEDTHKRPTLLTPIPLAGVPDRISQIVQAHIQEPPFVKITTIESASDRALGYVVVFVPPSDRAPHMVIVRDINSYYGRNATGNRKLGEREVARLYERRQRFEVDREALLTDEITAVQAKPDKNYAYLYMYVRPVTTDEDMIKKILKDQNTLYKIFNRLDAIYRPKSKHYLTHPRRWDIQANGYRTIMEQEKDSNAEILTLELDDNGMGHVFCARVAEKRAHGFIFSSDSVAATTSRLIGIMGSLYEEAGYFGMVDIGIAITNLKNAIPAKDEGLDCTYPPIDIPYTKNEYRKTLRASAAEIAENPQQVAFNLVIKLIQAITQDPNVNPFQKAKPS